MDNEFPDKGGNEARTEWVAPESTFISQDHDWTQRGYEISCTSCRFNHGSFIPAGKTLIGERGNWELIADPVG